jgi:hypothetical protein
MTGNNIADEIVGLFEQLKLEQSKCLHHNSSSFSTFIQLRQIIQQNHDQHTVTETINILKELGILPEIRALCYQLECVYETQIANLFLG